MKNIKKALSGLVCLAALGTWLITTSCQDDDQTMVIGNELQLMKSSINKKEAKQGWSQLPTNVEIDLLFTHQLETAKVLSALKISGAEGDVPYEAIFSNTDSRIVLNNQDELRFESTYEITLPAGVYGSKGEALENDLKLSFTTEKFTPPQIRLIAERNELSENNDQTTVKAVLNKVTDQEVSLTIETGGTATLDADYTLEPLQLTIPAGSLEAVAVLNTITDGERETDETILLTPVQVTNADVASNATASILIQETAPPLALKGIMAMTWDGSGTNDGKAIHLVANEDIADLSIYWLGVANNGGGTDGPEYQFPAMSVAAGEQILVARVPDLLANYFGGCMSEFDHVLLATTVISQNGDDAIELFADGQVIETFGDADVLGVGQEWEYTGSWAYKQNGQWIYGGVNCTVGATTNDASFCKYPICEPGVELKGVMAMTWETSGTNGGKAIHLKVNKDIDDLSVFSIGVANNGGGTDGIEYTLPAVSAKEGDDILIAREPATLGAYFGNCMNTFELVLTSNDAISQNGDDAIELFLGADVIETYGSATVDGTGQLWEYTNSWAYKQDGIWITGALECSTTANTTQESACVYPICE